jgi:diguanylate cyclase (GGDEF)-like protein
MIVPSRKVLLLLSLQICFSLFGCISIFADAYHFDSWTTDNGLPQNGVRSITQTPDGYLWFTTFDGLVRFDGIRFTTFNKGNTKEIINNRFTTLYSDKDGALYAATMEDGVLTTYRNGVFFSYNSAQVPGHYIKSIEADEKGEVRYLSEDDDHQTESWFYLRDGKFVFSEQRDKLRSKLEYRGKSGTDWTITKTEITEFRGGVKSVYEHQTQAFDFQRDAFEDSSGTLWIGGKTLSRLSNGAIERFGEKEGFPVDSDFHLFWEESDGSVWFANGGQTAPGVGLVRFKDGKFQIFGKDQGLSETHIYNIFKDREGTVWLATNKGINRLRKNVISAHSVKDGLNNSEVYPIYKDSKGAIWIGTVKGLNVYRDGKFEEVLLKQAAQDVPEHTKWRNGETSVQSIFEDSNGKMWIGVNGAIFTVQNGEATVLHEAEGYHGFAILQDTSGTVWIASNRGILRFNDYKLTAVFSTESGLSNDFVSSVFEDSRGRLWFGGLGGLSEYKDGKFINYTIDQGLAGNYVRSIYESGEGTLWIGTYDEGLSRFKNGRFDNIKMENGLFNNGVFAIEEDNRGNFWISSNQGIYRVSRAELNEFADGKITSIHSVGYGKEDGMLNSECNGGRQPASVKDEKGHFWFPTQDGVVVVDPEIETLNPLPPSVVIESATVERKIIDISNGLHIEPGEKNIEIRYTGISLIKSEQVKFKYKLENHDADWIDAGTHRSAYYSYLPPGDYQFKVIAANSDDVWNETGSTIELELKPYFYQTKWFYLLIGAIAIFGFLAIWKTSLYRLQVREKLLKRLVAERTIELKRANENLLELANSDGLTDVANRRRFEEFLRQEWSRAARFKNEISLIMIDIDHFKLYNDTYGHQAGDECLKRVAAALKETINRPTDLVARFGGEEFVIVLGVTDIEGTLSVAEHVMEKIRELRIPHKSTESEEYLTVSIGVATTNAETGVSEFDLISAADKALYFAKENGRNQIKTFDLKTPSAPDFLKSEEIGVR